MPALRSALTRRPQDLYLGAFDLLHLNGHDLRDMPLGILAPAVACSRTTHKGAEVRRALTVWNEIAIVCSLLRRPSPILPLTNAVLKATATTPLHR